MTEDYDEVEAVVRIPKGRNLANSKEDREWKLGFTPKSAEQGPEFVKIRIKDEEDFTAPDEPDFIYAHEYDVPPREKTPEQRQLEEIAKLLMDLAIIKAVQWAHPPLQSLWEGRVIPFFVAAKHRWQQRKEQRNRGEQVESSVAVPRNAPTSDSGKVEDALDAYKANMTSAEVRRHFIEALIAQRFANDKMQLLADHRIEDDGDARVRELADAVKALTAEQVQVALNSVLASTPTLIDELEKLIRSARANGGLQLGSDEFQTALRLTDGR